EMRFQLPQAVSIDLRDRCLRASPHGPLLCVHCFGILWTNNIIAGPECRELPVGGMNDNHQRLSESPKRPTRSKSVHLWKW
ncbi:MAG: hypothetical protein AB1729_01880, partial [Pseudomonadota bacterium]